MIDYLKEFRKKNNTFIKAVEKAVNNTFSQYTKEIIQDPNAVFELQGVSEHYINYMFESSIAINMLKKEFGVNFLIEKVSDDSFFRIIFDKPIKYKNDISFVFDISEQFDKYSNIKNVKLAEYKIVNHHLRLDIAPSMLSFSFSDKLRYLIKRNTINSQVQEFFEFRDSTRSNMWKDFFKYKETIKSKEDLSSFLFEHYFVVDDSVSMQIFSSFKYILDFYNSGALTHNPDAFEQFLINRLFQKQITKEEKELLDMLFLEKDFSIEKLSQNIKILNCIQNIKKIKKTGN